MSTFQNLYKAEKKFKKRKWFEHCYVKLKDFEHCYLDFGILNVANLKLQKES